MLEPQSPSIACPPVFNFPNNLQSPHLSCMTTLCSHPTNKLSYKPPQFTAKSLTMALFVNEGSLRGYSRLFRQTGRLFIVTRDQWRYYHTGLGFIYFMRSNDCFRGAIVLREIL